MPNVTPSFTQSTTELTVNITDTSVAGLNTSLINWTFYTGEGTFVDGIQNPSYTYLSAGTYPVRWDVTGQGTTGNVYGPNLITNHDFETGTFALPWADFTDGTPNSQFLNAGGPTGSAFYHRTIMGTGSTNTQLYHGPISFTAGQLYEIRFFARASIPSDVRVRINEFTTNVVVAPEQTQSLTTGWTEYILNFTPTVSSTNARIQFYFPDIPSGTSVDFDEVIVRTLEVGSETCVEFINDTVTVQHSTCDAVVTADSSPVYNDLLTVNFTASTMHNSGWEVVSYDWAFGDGNTEIGGAANTSHTYATVGVFNVTVTANLQRVIPTGPQLVQNNIFNNTVIPWVWEVNDVVTFDSLQFPGVGGSGFYAVMTIPANHISSKLSQSVAPVTLGQKYQLIFWARGTSSNNQVRLYNNTASTLIGLSESFEVGNIWQEYVYVFTATQNEVNARLEFSTLDVVQNNSLCIDHVFWSAVTDDTETCTGQVTIQSIAGTEATTVYCVPTGLIEV